MGLRRRATESDASAGTTSCCGPGKGNLSSRRQCLRHQRLHQDSRDLLLQGPTLIKQEADILSRVKYFLAKVLFVNTRQLIWQALVFLKISLSFSHLTIKLCDGLRGGWPRGMIFFNNHLAICSI